MVPAISIRSVVHKTLLIHARVVKGRVQEQVAVFGQGERWTGLKDLLCLD